MSQLNDYGLDYYLRGEAGELARREAQQELYRRGHLSSSVEEMITRLEALGYAMLAPEDLAGDRCPWCGVPYWEDHDGCCGESGGLSV